MIISIEVFSFFKITCGRFKECGDRNGGQVEIDLGWFLCLMTYKPSWEIYCQSHTCRRIAVICYKFANGPRDLGSIPGRVIPKILKMVLGTSLLNTQQYKVLSKVKWSNPVKGVAASPTPRCSSY